ncbi:MAG TPA: cytochrome b N-terminal domain-containing protein, partial [Acidobacteriaceae bacterium]|nr:cytochrome b N-terminal domain-containing protein [Acidobacteriaceae bacterium]
ISSAVPVFGSKFHFLMLGGNQVNANALLRFYVLHCVILPLAAVLFVAVHFWRIRKDGGLYVRQSEPAREQAGETAAVAAAIDEPVEAVEVVMEKR